MIRIRPYYLYTILRQLAAGDEPVEDNSIPQIVRRLVASGFREELQLVQSFGDACPGCPRMVPDPQGCLWGEGFRCKSSETLNRLHEVENQMRAILYDLGLRFGDVRRADELLLRAIERRPYHYSHSPQWQEAMERGIQRFTELTGLKPRIPEELRLKRRYYFQHPS